MSARSSADGRIGLSSTAPRSPWIGLDRKAVTGNDKPERHSVDDEQDSESILDKPAPLQDGKDHNLVTWDGPDDPDNPRNWSTPYKLFLTTLCCITTLNVYVSEHSLVSADCLFLYHQNIRLISSNACVDIHRQRF
jgi:hypothetical protein